MLFSNIPLLWEILEQITQDWKREATPFRRYVKSCVKVRVGLLGGHGQFSEGQRADDGIEH